jgi:hypothetical protein
LQSNEGQIIEVPSKEGQKIKFPFLLGPLGLLNISGGLPKFF